MKYILSVQDDNPLQRISFLMSDMNDQMQRLTSRISHVENDIKQLKEAALNKSLQFAVESIQDTLSGLVYTMKEADYIRTEVKKLLCVDIIYQSQHVCMQLILLTTIQFKIHIFVFIYLNRQNCHRSNLYL